MRVRPSLSPVSSRCSRRICLAIAHSSANSDSPFASLQIALDPPPGSCPARQGKAQLLYRLIHSPINAARSTPGGFSQETLHFAQGDRPTGFSEASTARLTGAHPVDVPDWHGTSSRTRSRCGIASILSADRRRAGCSARASVSNWARYCGKPGGTDCRTAGPGGSSGIRRTSWDP